MKSGTNKSIFYNLMRLCIIIVIICSVLMSILNIFLSNSRFKKEKATELKYVSDQVNALTSQYTKKYSEETNYFYQLSLDQLARYINGTIIIVNSNGTVFANSKTNAEIPATIDLSDYKDVLMGSSTYRTGGFINIFGYNTFSVASPFTYQNNVEGIIFVVTRNTVLNSETIPVVHMNLFSVATAIVFSLVASYFLSVRFIKPLKKIENAAKDITAGRYVTLKSSSGIKEYNELITSFNKMSSDLEKQDKIRSDFIANVSHDLRTPLTTIMGFTKGIMDGTIPPEAENQYLGVVLSEAERMKNMVANNLDLSKYESGMVRLNMSVFNLNDIIRSVCLSMEKRIREKGIVIDFSYEFAENFVEADESTIHRVVQNILDNALKFASKNSQIEISITVKEKLTHCRIKNYGSTISDEEQKYIWDRYYKIDKSRSVDKKGSGLGLFIVKNIMNQHNQQIFIDSGDNYTAFEFTLNTAKC